MRRMGQDLSEKKKLGQMVQRFAVRAGLPNRLCIVMKFTPLETEIGYPDHFRYDS